MTKLERQPRKAAGEDPAKRQQILDGARRIFLKMGYDAASMNDITREAGVSKGTIYVYFANKEDLFSALVEHERNRMVAASQLHLETDLPVDQVLYNFAVSMIHNFSDNIQVSILRILLGVLDRLPECSRKFLGCVPVNNRTILQQYLEQQVQKGNLVIDDCEMAAQQFIDLSNARFLKQRLFEHDQALPSEAEIHRVVSAAVKLFMTGYGPR